MSLRHPVINDRLAEGGFGSHAIALLPKWAQVIRDQT